MTERKHVYVLRLERGNAYVGVSKYPERRIYEHMKGTGYHWTNQHQPQRVLSVTPPIKNCLEVENAVALWMATILGTENVAGGDYTRRDMRHGFPSGMSPHNPDGWDVFGTDPGVAIGEYLGLDEQMAEDWGVPLE